jgi:hypothetical protein
MVVPAPCIEERHFIRQVELLPVCLNVSLVVPEVRTQTLDKGYVIIQADRGIELRPVPPVVP